MLSYTVTSLELRTGRAPIEAMRMRTWIVLLGGLLIGAPSSLAAQQGSSSSALVVDIPSDNLYHQPSCPLVRKAGSRVKVMKESEAVRRGMKPHDCAAAAEGDTAAEKNQQIVYVQPDDNKYHKAGCEKLKDGATKMTLDEAGKKHWPCPVCKPPVRQRSKP
jgi:hypothetical protein